MPKHEIIHQAGQRLETNIREDLLKYFKDSDLDRLERLGGRIAISITAPYIDRKKTDNKNIIIDQAFVKDIFKDKDSNEKIDEKLKKLSVKQLRKLSDMVGQPIRSNANAGEIRAELIKYIQAENFWQRISGIEK